MTTAKIEITTIPLGKLAEDGTNVRRVGRQQGIEELAALIEAQGLLNPLSVRAITKEDGTPTGRYGVIAGGRRHRALVLLASQKRLPKNAPVACRIVTDGNAAEHSLAENSGRLVMHPADQCDAFHKLHAEGTGQTVEQIAQRFGITPQTVRQRLRLASVSPVLMERFREGGLTLDQMTAFALTDDHEAQERVATFPDYVLTAHYIRNSLTQGEVPATDRRARFVAVDAYEAAGGTVRRDLFSDDRGGWLTDPQLLDRLVSERIEADAATVRAEGWAWVDVLPKAPDDLFGTPRVRPQELPLSPEAEAEIARVQARMDEIEAETGDADLTEEQDAELARLETRRDELQDQTLAFAPEDVARSGAVMFLAHEGVQVVRGILREADPVLPAERPRLAVAGDRDVDDDKGSTLSAALLAELAAHRTAALQAEVAMRPHLALCLLVQTLAAPYASAMSVRVVPPALSAACPGIEDTDARQRTRPDEIAALDRAPGGADLLPWLVDQDTDTLLAILAPLVARGIDSGSTVWADGKNSPALQAAQLAGLDMRLWWKADATSYLGRVPKALILDAVRQGAGDAAAAELSGMKKEPMAAAAERRLSESGWLPPVLRVPVQPEPVELRDAAE